MRAARLSLALHMGHKLGMHRGGCGGVVHDWERVDDAGNKGCSAIPPRPVREQHPDLQLSEGDRCDRDVVVCNHFVHTTLSR